MLTQIHIRDLVTIEELHLHLQSGHTVITGETGAGKSIFIEAIELALGGRASTNMVRLNKERADISLCFDIEQQPKIIAWLKEYDLYHSAEECIIRRVITSDSRSRCYINGLPTTVQLVRELSELLFHLHSQHEQQILLKSENQRDMLDRYAGYAALAAEVKHIADEWKMVNQQIKNLREQALTHHERSHYLRFQLDELLALQLQAGEWEKLEAEHYKLTHSDELIRQLQQGLHHLTDQEDRNALSILHDIRKSLESLQTTDPRITNWLNLLQSVNIQLSDLEIEWRHYLETVECDSARLYEIEQRISQLFNLARKHKVTPPDLIQIQTQFTEELNTLSSSDTALEKLIEQQKKLATQYHELATKLSESRAKAAILFAKQITTTIRGLSLPHSEFTVQLEKETIEFSPHGLEKVIFTIKTNPDQRSQPIVKAISGGELSRLSLAIHLALAHQTVTPILIFDEVDTGIGGATAEKIGKLLRQLGESYQVFCVTHQPQVAALGHHHLLVEKQIVANSTYTHLRLLTTEEKTIEIARMLGGEKMTQKTLAHAQEILAAQ